MNTEEIRDKVEDVYIKETERFAFLDPNKIDIRYVEWLEQKLVKNLTIPCVSDRRELLIAFCNKWNNDRTDFAKIELEEIDSFLLKAIYSC